MRALLFFLLLISTSLRAGITPDVGKLYSPSVIDSYWVILRDAPPFILEKEDTYKGEDYCAIHDAIVQDTQAGLLGYFSSRDNFPYSHDMTDYFSCPGPHSTGEYAAGFHLRARGCLRYHENGGCAEWKYAGGVWGGGLDYLMKAVKSCPAAAPYEDHIVPVSTSSGIKCAKPLQCDYPFEPEITYDDDGYISKTECVTYCPKNRPLDYDLGICKPNPGDVEESQCPEKVFNPIITATGEKVQTVKDDFNLPGQFPLSFTLNYGSQTLDDIKRSIVVNKAATENAARYYRYVQPSSYSGPQYQEHFHLQSLNEVPAVGDRQWISNLDWRLFVKNDGRVIIKNGEDNIKEFPVLDQSVNGELVRSIESGWLFIAKNGLRYTFDAEGKVSRIDHISGESHTYEYDGDQLYRIHHSDFGSLSLEYSGQLLTRIILPDGGNYTYQYDSLNNLVAITNPENNSKIFHYEDARHPYALTGITDERGVRYATWEYDAEGRAVTSSHASGVDRGEVDYGAGLVTTTDVLGNVTTFNYDSNNRLQSVHGQTCDSSGQPDSVVYGYDTKGRVTQKTYHDNDAIKFSYDSQGFIQTTTRIDGQTQEEQKTYANYNPDNTLRQTVNYREGSYWNKTRYAYDDNFLIRSIEENYYRTNRTTHFDYAAGKRLKQIDGPRVDANDITTFTYDQQGRLASTTNALGHAVTYLAYDQAGRLLAMEDANGVATQYSYDGLGRLYQVEVEGQVTEIEYDAIGQITAVSDGVSRVNYIYDDARRLVEIRDGEGNSVHLERDLAGNVLSRKVRGSAQTITATQTFLYDKIGRLIKSTDGSNAAWQYEYDKANNLVKKTDPAGSELLNSFDGFDRRVADTDQLGEQTSYAYNENGQITSVTDAQGHTTTYQYNGFGERVAEHSPNRGTITYEYDAAGNRTRKEDANGVVVTYQYDALNRLIAARYPATPGQDIIYQYDDTENGNKGIGRLTGILFAAGERHYTYDALGRVIRDTQRIGSQEYTVSYQYNDKGQLTRLDLPSGARLHYSYDAFGQLASQSFQDGASGSVQPIAEQIDFLPFGPMSSFTYGNGITRSHDYDLDYRLVGQHSTVWNADYSYDLNGNITAITHDPAGLEQHIFGYDLVNRLVDAQSDQHRQYTYDGVGNRLSLTAGGATSQYGYGANNQHLLQRDQDTFQYDAAGNLTHNDRFTFAYTVDGHLASVADVVTGEAIAHYAYNPDRQRIQKTVNDTTQADPTTHYVYHLDGSLLGEYDASGTAQREYLYLNGQPLAVHTSRPPLHLGKALFYYHNDHLGTPKVLTDELGVPVWQASHTPFGQAQIETEVMTNNLRFPGQYYDVETGLHYNWNRYYDPSLGRYVTSDPIGLSAGWNTYVYVNSNPLVNTDPSGLINLKIPGAVGETAVHANPGPEVVPPGARSEHNPPHVHLGGNDGPRISTETWEPLDEKDKRRMSRKQERFCKNLTPEKKKLISTRQSSVFKHGHALKALMTGSPLLSVTQTCQQDPMFCLQLIENGNL